MFPLEQRFGIVAGEQLFNVGPELIQDVSLGNRSYSSQSVFDGACYGLVAVRDVSVGHGGLGELAEDLRKY